MIAGAILGALALSSPSAVAEPLETLTIGVPLDFPQHATLGENNELRGARPAFWDYWSKKSGTPIRMIPVRWGQEVDLLASGKVDVVDPLLFNPEKAKRLDLSEKPYYTATVHAFFNAKLGGIRDAEALRGYAVAVPEKGDCRKWLIEHGVLNIRLYPDIESMVKGTVNHEAEIFCTGKLAGYNHLSKLGAQKDFRISEPLYKVPFHWAVAKGNTELRKRIQAGFDLISKDETDAINQNWYGSEVEPGLDPIWLKMAGGIAAAISLVILGLMAWNWMLRRQVSKALAERKSVAEQMATIVNNLHGAVYRVRLLPGQRDLIYNTEGYENFLGIPTQSLQSMAQAERLKFIHPDDQALFDQRRAKLIANGSLVERVRLVRPDSGIRWLEYRERLVERLGDEVIAEGVVLEVTEEVEAEVKLYHLENSERVLANIVNTMPNPAWAKDLESRYIAVNKAFADFVGAGSAENLLGKKNTYCFPPTHAENGERIHKQMLASGQEITTEEQIPNANGEERCLEVRRSFLRDSQGAIVGTIGLAHDITERKKLEDDLHKREREFRSLADNMPDNVARWDVEGRYLYINPTHERTLGKSAENVLGKTIDQVFPGGVVEGALGIDKVIELGKPFTLERLQVPGEDGEIRFHDVKFVPEFDENGTVTSVLGIGRDMTDIYWMQAALASSEREYRSLAENSQDPIFRYDRECRRIYANPVAERISGKSVSNIVGKRPDEGQHLLSEQSRLLVSKIRQVFEAGRADPIELAYIDKNGTRRLFHMFLAPEYGADGQVETVLGVARDITEIRNREEALRESEKRLNEAQRIAHIGNWELDLVNDALYWSDQIFEIFEIDPREFRASYEGFLNAIHPGDREAVNDAYTQSVANKTPYNIIHRLLMTDGRIKYVNETCETTYNEQGQPVRSAGTVQDITERKLAELKMEQERQHFESILNVLPVGVFETDNLSNNLLTNHRWAEFAGLAPEEIRGTGWHKAIHPDDLERVAADWKFAMATKGTVSHEARIVAPNGKTTLVRTRGVPRYSNEGVLEGYVGVSEDITIQREMELKLRESQAKYRSLAEMATIVSWEYDMPSDTWPYVSPNAATILGYPPGEWRDMNWWVQRVYEEDRETAVNHCLEETKKLRDHTFEYRFVKKDGAVVWLQDIVNVVAKDGKPVALRGIMTDISERKEVEAKLERQQEAHRKLELQIQEARKLESLGRLAGGVAHDFNNILGAIIGYSEFICEDHGHGTPANNHAKRILSASRRGKDIVDQILLYSRQIKTGRERFCLSAVIDETLPLLQIAIPSTIRLEIDEKPPKVVIDGNKSLLGQALMNLCFNARDSLGEHNGVISIKVQEVGRKMPWDNDGDGATFTSGQYKPGNEYVSLCVKDNGNGINPDKLPQIFDPFFTTKGVGQGTGLGLSVVHGVVSEHDGVIVVRTKAGAGSEFHLLLPLAKSADERLAEMPSPTPGSTASATLHVRALIVDDDQDICDMLAELLHRKDWWTDRFTNPELALSVFKSDPHAWDIVITDQIMPGLRGQDLISMLKVIKPDLPCILCTGYDETLSEERAKSFGASALLNKPIQSSALLKAIQDALLM
jgi:PAS domain S-box-containing protein